MKSLLLIIFTGMSLTGILEVFKFSKETDLSHWQVINDGVMGGLSEGHLIVNNKGNGVYYGSVSLDNNGGFSSVRYRLDPIRVKHFSRAVIRVKGDGKRYQFRVKSSTNERHSYISYFHTNGEWQEIQIDLNSMYPSFRGQRLDRPNYPGNVLEEIAFLIGNKKAEAFQLEIDYIQLR